MKPFKETKFGKALISFGNGVMGGLPLLSVVVPDVVRSSKGLTKEGQTDWVQLITTVVTALAAIALVLGKITPEQYQLLIGS
ncbi:hypothetical protein V6R21_20330 [Limibacter armeniacum]|uniref:hypothetical protein n=1 Tax=Limibacter armeniacum TaxID=466084 RepID=UPI002FE5BA7D